VSNLDLSRESALIDARLAVRGGLIAAAGCKRSRVSPVGSAARPLTTRSSGQINRFAIDAAA